MFCNVIYCYTRVTKTTHVKRNIQKWLLCFLIIYIFDMSAIIRLPATLHEQYVEQTVVCADNFYCATVSVEKFCQHISSLTGT